jgi:hypothetical protein
LLGDFNNNGVVDAADYVVWGKNVGQPAGTLPNDDTGVAIGDQQHALWRSNFGDASSGASAAEVAVPEPDGGLGAVLLLVTAAFCRFYSRRGQP